LDDKANERVFSAAVAYEISLKAALQKLTLPMSAPEWIHDRIKVFRAVMLPITVEHACVAAGLPMHHRDPFDRLLVAQAQVEGFTLVTADVMCQQYGVPILRAT